TTTPNDGVETLAYVPGAVLSMIHSTTSKVDFSSPSYSHNLYVDATPGTGDLYYNGAWHTWLVGGLGGGGNASGTIADSTTSTGGTLY
ncbi:PilC/PilY family type IV pilus protein, partial [Ralstonia solanacearum]